MDKNDKRPVAFLDRDGVINTRVMGGYVQSVSGFVFIPTFLDVYAELNRKGYPCIVISNQQGVGKGLMSMETLMEIDAYMRQELKRETGFDLLASYYCTDLAGTNSERRKPRPGMLREATLDHNVEQIGSFFVGDTVNDAKAGRAAGVRTILIGDFEHRRCPEADVVCTNHEALLEYVREFIPKRSL